MLCLHFLCRPHALREVVNHLYAMGLRNPSEPTYGLLSCLIGYDQFQSMEVSKFQEYFSFHQSMKSQAQDILDRLRKLETTAETNPLITLPENPDELKHLKVFAQEGPAKPRINLAHLNHMANTLPLRKSNRFSGQQNPANVPGQTPSNLPFVVPPHVPSMNMLAMAGGLQSGWHNALALAQMLQPQGTKEPPSMDLRNLKMLTPQAVEPNAKSQDHAAATNLTATTSTTPALVTFCQPEAKAHATPQPMALMDGKAEDAGQGQENSVKIGDPSVQEVQENKPSVQEVQEKKPQPSLPALDMVRLALDAREGDKKSTAGMKRPASCGGKHKATKDDTVKAAVTPKAKPKPKATSKAKSVLKKPSAKMRGTVSQTERFRWRPEGCSTCRWRRGCTDSCWIKRKLRPI